MYKKLFFVVLLLFAVCALSVAAEDALHPRFIRDACTGHKCPANEICVVANYDCVQDGPGCGAQPTCLPNGGPHKA
uniref:Uncharacterized protein n=1 Tax=Panagrolaimus sp. ES5 TaxID=591445 RepID=A0AC34FYL4_9BILA